MNKEFEPDRVGEDAIVKETRASHNFANYMAYEKLKEIGYTDEDAASHIGITDKQLLDLRDEFDPGTQ